MFRNIRRTCWNKYVNELEQKLNEQILPPVPVSSSKKDIDVLANKVSLHLAEKHFSENHLPEKHFPELSFSRINICQKSHLPE